MALAGKPAACYSVFVDVMHGDAVHEKQQVGHNDAVHPVHIGHHRGMNRHELFEKMVYGLLFFYGAEVHVAYALEERLQKWWGSNGEQRVGVGFRACSQHRGKDGDIAQCREAYH